MLDFVIWTCLWRTAF